MNLAPTATPQHRARCVSACAMATAAAPIMAIVATNSTGSARTAHADAALVMAVVAIAVAIERRRL